MKVINEEDLEKETLVKIKVEEPKKYIVYSKNFHSQDKMFSIYGLEREIFNFE